MPGKNLLGQVISIISNWWESKKKINNAEKQRKILGRLIGKKK